MTAASKFAVYRTGGTSALGQERAYVGLAELSRRSGCDLAQLSEDAAWRRWQEHADKGARAARFTIPILHLTAPQVLDANLTKTNKITQKPRPRQRKYSALKLLRNHCETTVKLLLDYYETSLKLL